MARRQIIGHGVNLELYAATHGKPNLVGQSIGGIGAVLGEAFEKAKAKKNKADEEAKTKLEELNNKITREAEIFDEDEDLLELEQDILDAETTDLFNQTKNELDKTQETDKGFEDKGITDPAKGGVVKTYDMVGDDVYANYLKKYPGQIFAAEAARAKAIQDAKAYNIKTKRTLDPTKTGLANNVVSFKTDKDGNVIPFSIKPTEGSTAAPSPEEYMGPPFGGPVKRLKNNPLKRRQIARGGVTQGIDSLMGNTRGVDTSAADRGEVSRFTPGRTFVEKERKLSAPSWLGVGAAAIEGWNLGVERENYKKQVQADLQDYYQQEFKGLEVGRTGNDLFDQSMQEVLMGEKKRLAKKLQEREAAFANGEGATWTAEYSQLKKVPTQVANLVDGVKSIRKDILEKYDQIDWSAMPDEATDEVMTFLKGGSALGLVPTESGLAVMGETRGRMPYLKNVQAMLQEGGGPKIILKKNAFNYVADVVEEIRKNPSKYSYTDEVDGVKTTKMLPMEQLKPYLDSMFESELLDKADVRSYASPNNFDKDGLTPELFDISVNNGKNPKEFVKQKFYEIAKNLLYPQQQVYDRQGTARLTQLQKTRLKQTQQSKGEAMKKNVVDYLLSPEAFTFVPDKIIEGQTAVPEMTTKSVDDYPGVKLFKGSSKVKDVDYNPKTGIMTIKPISNVRVSGTGKDAKTSISTKEPIKVNFNQDPETLRLILGNLAEEFNIDEIPVSSQKSEPSQAISEFDEFAI